MNQKTILAETDWFRLEFPWIDPDPWFHPSGPRKTQTITYAKALMSKLGFKFNVDFRISADYYSKNIVILLHPRIEQYASWIALQWE